MAAMIACIALPAWVSSSTRIEVAPLDSALTTLARTGAFSGAVVIRSGARLSFAKGYGWADPFTRRRFTPTTPVDSASLAKPVTAAVVLMLARQGRLDLDAPVTRYVAEFPHAQTTVRQLLTHSAGLPGYQQLEPISGKTNADLLSETRRRGIARAFAAGTAFSYCNLCYDTLALIVERVGRRPYLETARTRLGLPNQIRLRPRTLAAWNRRAIGHSAAADGTPTRADSLEGEAFFGSANLSVSAMALADWGALWWSALAPLRELATSQAPIGGGVSGLTLGSWYCAPGRMRCHYLEHHQGFHHMLYWDAERQLSVAMVTNNSLAPPAAAAATGNHRLCKRPTGSWLCGAFPARAATRSSGGHLLHAPGRDRRSDGRRRLGPAPHASRRDI